MVSGTEVARAATALETVGSVVARWRYPVKSMQGEERNAAELTQRGRKGEDVCGPPIPS